MAEAERKVEMEEVTLKLPKALMDFLRMAHGSKTVEWLEHDTVMSIRSYIEALGSDSEELEKVLKLDKVFKAILDC